MHLAQAGRGFTRELRPILRGYAPEILIDAREFITSGSSKRNPAKASPIDTQQVTQHKRIAAVVFGGGHLM
jgi:hypothetical protein